MGEGQPSAIRDLIGVEVGAQGSTPGSGGMSSEKRLWSAASEGLSSLRGTLRTATGTLTEKQHSFGVFSLATTGFATGAAQRSVCQTWERYLGLLGRESGELAGKLEKAGNDHYRNDEAVKAAFESQAKTWPTARAGDPRW